MGTKDEAIALLRGAGLHREALALERWQNKDKRNLGWDRWFVATYPESAAIAGVGGKDATASTRPRTNAREPSRKLTDGPAGSKLSADLLSLSTIVQRLHPAKAGGRQFDVYAFADYRGDARDARGKDGKGVVLAIANGEDPAVLVRDVGNRQELRAAFQSLLDAASAGRMRVLFGQDHQLGVPIALAEELGLPVKDGWRVAMKQLFMERFAASAAGQFGREVNGWLKLQSRSEYFWSNTKGKDYGIPGPGNPRAKDESSQWRLTELSARRGAARPFPFSQLGDNGSVGGQTIVGMPNVLKLLDWAEAKGIRVNVWPFDGPTAAALDGHLAIEPYPSHVREPGVKQTDANDALACVMWAQQQDKGGRLGEALSLRSLDQASLKRARFEGWIAGVQS